MVQGEWTAASTAAGARLLVVQADWRTAASAAAVAGGAESCLVCGSFYHSYITWSLRQF